jgi:hypothetical protein
LLIERSAVPDGEFFRLLATESERVDPPPCREEAVSVWGESDALNLVGQAVQCQERPAAESLADYHLARPVGRGEPLPVGAEDGIAYSSGVVAARITEQAGRCLINRQVFPASRLRVLAGRSDDGDQRAVGAVCQASNRGAGPGQWPPGHSRRHVEDDHVACVPRGH